MHFRDERRSDLHREIACTLELFVGPQHGRRRRCRCANCVGGQRLRLSVLWHTLDVLNNRNLDGDFGSDGSTP
jgi:hypothetical protein